jgi:hypothetical protein
MKIKKDHKLIKIIYQKEEIKKKLKIILKIIKAFIQVKIKKKKIQKNQ